MKLEFLEVEEARVKRFLCPSAGDNNKYCGVMSFL